MARSSVLSSTRSKGSIGFEKFRKYACAASDAANQDEPRVVPFTRLARPARITAGTAKLVLQAAELLFEVGNFFFLGGNFIVLLVDIRARILFLHGLLWVRVILEIGFFGFTLKNAQCFFCVGN